MSHSGLIIGHFEPLHLGHMRTILHASGLVDTLHIIITKHPNPNAHFPVTLQDKARWLQMACQDLPFIHIHTTDDLNFPVHDNIEDIRDIDTVMHTYNAEISHLSSTFEIGANRTLFVSDGHPFSKAAIKERLDINVMTTPFYKRFNSLDIHDDPITHWDVIHPEARGNYTRTVAIVGGESSGKTTLVHKLANYYGADLVLEMGRLYVHTDLGGKEVGLQYSDYAPIALDHAHAVREALYKAQAPVTIVDTDFVTTQAFCEVYEGRTHPFVASCIDEFRFDHTLLLTNNTPWVDDGLRSLGSERARAQFEKTLLTIFDRHHIAINRISSPDYVERFEKAVVYIDKHIIDTDF